MTFKKWNLIVLSLIAILVLAACQPAAEEAEEPAEEEAEEPAEEEAGEPAEEEASTEDLTGDVLVDGSSTVFPITEAVAEEFRNAAPDVRVTVGVSGTGGGFEKFCNGETDISNASRPIKESEVELCAENGIEYIEVPAAYDGLAVMVNPSNDFAQCLTVDELAAIWAPEAQGEITNWNQVREDFPDAPLSLYGAGTDSGTYDYFTDAIVGEEGASRGDFTASEDDNVLVQGIGGDENALGFFGLAYYEANQDSLQLVAVEDPATGECVEPTPETVAQGTYQPLSRPIFIYVRADVAERPEVDAFVDFYIDNSAQLSNEVGYIGLPEVVVDGVRDRWDNRVVGSLFPDGSTVGVDLRTVYSEGEPAEEEASTEDLTGDVLVDGSSTVFPITEAVAEEFRNAAPDVRVTVGVSGTGGGFEKFCNGETDISNASRPIKESEVELCAENGIEYIEVPAAYDGLAVMVNPSNDFAQCLTVDELAAIWAPEAQGEITNWNQVREDFPDAPLSLYGAGTDSGTYDYFTDAIVGEEGASRGDFTASEDDNVLVQGIGGDENALGFFGLAYYEANQDSLQLVAVEDPATGECVEPTPETVAQGTYQPLSRPIFIYVRADVAERPEVDAFVDFYIDNSAQLSNEVGYIGLPEVVVDGVRDRWDNRVVGSLFPDGSTVGVDLRTVYSE